MNPQEGERWKSHLLDEIFIALAATPSLQNVLIFKGARVLNLRLTHGRQSLDLDSNLTTDFVRTYTTREEQRQFLEQEMSQAIRRRFEKAKTVQYELRQLKIQSYPPKSHPMGWDAFKVKINVDDLSRKVLGLPALEIDVAAPEALYDHSIATLDVGGYQVFAYTLERIAGEKMRAFLSSLPTYRAKMKKPGEAVRAKDLYDLSRIHRVHDLDFVDFWLMVGKEFQLACQSRYIDCLGLISFQEQWTVTQKTYEEATIPKDIDFKEAESTLGNIVGFFETRGLIPFEFPIGNHSSELLRNRN